MNFNSVICLISKYILVSWCLVHSTTYFLLILELKTMVIRNKTRSWFLLKKHHIFQIGVKKKGAYIHVYFILWKFQNEEFVVFRDIKPAAEHHYLVIPKCHIPDPKQLSNGHVTMGMYQFTSEKELLLELAANLSQKLVRNVF